MRILHVEDNEDNRDIIFRILQDHEVISCGDMESAKAAYQQQDFDLVICDGSVDTDNDGQDWAFELYNAGQAVVVFSGGDQVYWKVPFIHKLQFPLRADTFLQYAKLVSR